MGHYGLPKKKYIYILILHGICVYLKRSITNKHGYRHYVLHLWAYWVPPDKTVD